MSKPQIVEGKKLTWSVADRTGVVSISDPLARGRGICCTTDRLQAKFYFQWRGPSSQYTWDWVLDLKPGDRKSLPRMPCVEVKEKKRVRLAKAPFRATGAVIQGTGSVIRAVGRGVGKFGTVMRMGPSSQWVAKADFGADGKKIDWSKVADSSVKAEEPGEKKPIDVFNKKGERQWSDSASVASTNIGSDFDEKTGKYFV